MRSMQQSAHAAINKQRGDRTRSAQKSFARCASGSIPPTASHSDQTATWNVKGSVYYMQHCFSVACNEPVLFMKSQASQKHH